MAEGEFGGLCENGHDVPAGARFCPSCGARAHGPSIPKGEQPSWPPPSPTAAPTPGGVPGHWPGPAAQGPYGYGASGPAIPPARGYAYPAPGQPPPGYGYPAPGPPRPGWYGPPPHGQPGLPSYWSYGPPAGRTNGLAIASMVLGMLWMWWIGSILAVILGHVALSQIRSSREGGRGLAIAGLALGYLGLAAGAVFFIAAVLSS